MNYEQEAQQTRPPFEIPLGKMAFYGAVGAAMTPVAAKIEAFTYPTLLKNYDTVSTFEQWRVLIAHEMQKNPTATVLVFASIISVLGSSTTSLVTT